MSASLSLFLSSLLHIVLLPPMSLFLLMGAGALLRRRHPRSGRTLYGAALAVLVLLCCDAGSALLVKPLEAMTTPLATSAGSRAQAIVVLAAGSIDDAPEYGHQDIPDRIALGRLRYGAHLQHESGLPLLVTGGNGSADGRYEAKAHAMARALREDFKTPVAWIEDRSATTAENAAFSAAILRRHKVGRILLVTDAMHMPRARRVFQRAGLEVVDAPTLFFGRGQLAVLDFMPTAAALQKSYYASYEWLGLAWYRLRE
jgi:uncharacterized SAM-binding protein YcdF (DUF218 family)